MQSKKSDNPGDAATRRHKAAEVRTVPVQEEELALEAERLMETQREACVRRADEDAASPVSSADVYEGRVNDGDVDRPALARLRRDVQASEVGVVYVWSKNRLSRDVQLLAALHQELATAGAEVRCASAPVGNPAENGTGREASAVHTMVRVARACGSLLHIAILVNVLRVPKLPGKRWAVVSVSQLLRNRTARRN